MCLIVLAVMEMAGTSLYAIHALGIVLLVSRLIHPFGIRFDKVDEWQRVVGATGTALVLLVASLWTIYLYVTRVFLVP